GDSPDEIFLFSLVLRPNRERVEHSQRQRESQRFILPVPQISLPQDLHPNHSLACSLHLPQHARHCRRVSIHVRADRINSCQIHLHPLRIGRGAQRFNTVAGAAVCPNCPFLLRRCPNLHHPPISRCPV